MEIMSNNYLFTLLLLLILPIYMNGFISNINFKGFSRKSLYMTSGGVTNIVPSSYYEVEKLLTKSILEVFGNIDSNNNDSNNNNSNTLYSIDMLTPGLNPKLEQKAILQLELLFNLLTVLCPILSSTYSDVRLQFPSTGDAASFQKYCMQTKNEIPDNCILEMVSDKYDQRNLDCDLENINCNNDCVLFIQIKNSVGDPLIDSIRKYCEQRNGLTAIFFNCDLSDKTTAGLQLKGQRDVFRNSIKPLFYFRNIVSISRPTLNPIEKGAIIYTPSTKWQLFAVNDDDIYGPGSLNRFMKVNTFMKDKRDKTSFDPPRFMLAGVFNDLPKRDEVDECLEKAYYSMSKGNEISIFQEKILSNSFIDKLKTVKSIDSNNSMDLFKILINSPITKETEKEEQNILQICKNLQNLYSKASNKNENYFDNNQKQGVVGYFDDNDQQLKKPRQTDKKAYNLLLVIDSNSGAIIQSSLLTQLTLSFLNDNKLLCVTDKYTYNGKYITNSNNNNGADMIGIFEAASAFAGFIKIPVPNILKEFNPYWILKEEGMALSINTIDKKSVFCIWKIIS